MSIIRAAIISGGSFVLYLFVAVMFFNVNTASADTYTIPGIVVALMFLLLIISDGSWVNKEYKKFLN